MDKKTYYVTEHQFRFIGHVIGSRPLNLCHAHDNFYYGEYRSNPERSPVNIWQWQQEQSAWQSVWQFTNVRHVHGIFHDPYTDSIWATTGDSDDESAIWQTSDNFKTLNKVVGGNQQFRAVQLLFTKEYVYFGSDAPEEQNYIYRMARDGANHERLITVDSSVFFASKVNERLFFSTAVEPSTRNDSRMAAIWSAEGNGVWERVAEYKKDSLPMRYFQYGQIQFPSGPGDDVHLYFSPFATAGHGDSYKMNITKG